MMLWIHHLFQHRRQIQELQGICEKIQLAKSKFTVIEISDTSNIDIIGYTYWTEN